MKWCSTCKEYKTIDCFSNDIKRKDGLCYNCKSCVREFGIKRRAKINNLKKLIVPDGFKRCFTCKEVKPIVDFYANRARSNGVLGSCKICVKKRVKYPKSRDNKIIYLEEQLAIEEWRVVKINNESLPYKISDCGRVLIIRTNKIAKPSFDQRGYPQIVLTHNKIRIGIRIHILVGLMFLENPNNLPELNHLKGNKLYPHKCNLEYSSHKDNIDHAYATGLKEAFNSYNHPLSKKVLDTETGEVYPSANFVIRKFGLKENSLHAKLNGKNKNDTKFIYA